MYKGEFYFSTLGTYRKNYVLKIDLQTNEFKFLTYLDGKLFISYSFIFAHDTTYDREKKDM
jgi:hypothetical protein